MACLSVDFFPKILYHSPISMVKLFLTYNYAVEISQPQGSVETQKENIHYLKIIRVLVILFFRLNSNVYDIKFVTFVLKYFAKKPSHLQQIGVGGLKITGIKVILSPKT